MARTKDTTDSDLRKRRSMFQQAMSDFENSGIPFKRKHIIEIMRKGDYPDYNTDKYYSDWGYVAKENTFVRSLTEGAYSRYVQDIYSKLLEYQEQLSDWQKEPPKIYRQTIESLKQSDGNPRVTRTIVTTVSPIVISNLGLQITKALLSLVKGDVMDTSFAIVQDEVESLRKKLEGKKCLQ